MTTNPASSSCSAMVPALLWIDYSITRHAHALTHYIYMQGFSTRPNKKKMLTLLFYSMYFWQASWYYVHAFRDSGHISNQFVRIVLPFRSREKRNIVVSRAQSFLRADALWLSETESITLQTRTLICQRIKRFDTRSCTHIRVHKRMCV